MPVWQDTLASYPRLIGTCFPSRVIRAARHLRLLALGALVLVAAVTPASAARPAKPPNPNVGIVDIFTTLGFQNGAAAGTGMIVSRSGEVLTNNHVIRGATALRVVDVTTGRSYGASVVGYSVSEDVAVLRLQGASNLRPIALGDSSSVRIGQRVVARGNAGGAGGTPKAATGTVTGLHRQIVARDDQGGTETLTNLIETNAPVEPGDSGGPLLNARGRAIGMITAGSRGFIFQNTRGLSYAIPINRARAILKQIRAGAASETVHVGPTAFLGVSVLDAPIGVQIAQVVSGSAAEAAGLSPGDVITSLNDVPIRTSTDLTRTVLSLTPGTTVAIEWVDVTGAAHSGRITPASGPPQ